MAKAPVVCTNCGSEGTPKTVTPGSVFIELVLWLCFLIPGIIYSLWRLNKRHAVCSVCGSAAVVPANSEAATRIKKKFA